MASPGTARAGISDQLTDNGGSPLEAVPARVGVPGPALLAYPLQAVIGIVRVPRGVRNGHGEPVLPVPDGVHGVDQRLSGHRLVADPPDRFHEDLGGHPAALRVDV